jgi:hypothetical protein
MNNKRISRKKRKEFRLEFGALLQLIFAFFA